MDISQAAIDAAGRIIENACGGPPELARALAKQTLEAAAPHLNGACALHGDLDQAVILRAISDPGSVVERDRMSYEPVRHWQMRAVVASLTRPADPAIPTGGTT
jgi:hypothetical protein